VSDTKVFLVCCALLVAVELLAAVTHWGYSAPAQPPCSFCSYEPVVTGR
jgi:hypothetical protein